MQKLLNPIVFFHSLLQLLGHFYIYISYPYGLPDKDNRENKTKYELPFSDGTWKAVNGGSIRENSHSWDILTQRYAYDFVIVDENGSSHKNCGEALSDYYCFEAEVVSPAAGEVVTVRNGVRDYTRVGDLSVDWKTRDFRGNHIVIKHSKDEFSFIAHIKKDSFVVKVGDRVRTGQLLALCGNSGHSTEPHIHFQLQNKHSFWFAMGLPVIFFDFERLRGLNFLSIKEDFIEKGDIVKKSS